MVSTNLSSLKPHEILSYLVANKKRWLVPAIVGGVLGLFYAVVRSDKWEATQALIVRNEAYNNLEGVGKFRQLDDMKVTQETIFEIAKSRDVLRQALAKVGPPRRLAAGKPWPTDKAIEQLRKVIKITPPKGVEFGRTEVFYLRVSDRNRERALALNAAICDATQSQYQQVLNRKAESMARELAQGVKNAQKVLTESQARLAEIESKVGADLIELRILHSDPSGQSNLRQKLIFVEGEIRRLQTLRRTNEELLKLLTAASEDPANLVSAPSTLLDAQPALKRLREGLVDSQLKTSALQGLLTSEHPQVQAALEGEEQIRNAIHDELTMAIRGSEAESRVISGQIQSLEDQLADLNTRLAVIADLRTNYSSLVSEVEHDTKLLQMAQDNLADARAKQAGAQSASLIARIDKADTGTRPIGPSRKLLVLAGALAGLFVGFGLILVGEAPVPTTPVYTGPTAATIRPTPAGPAENLTLRQALERLSVGTGTQA